MDDRQNGGAKEAFWCVVGVSWLLFLPFSEPREFSVVRWCVREREKEEMMMIPASPRKKGRGRGRREERGGSKQENRGRRAMIGQAEGEVVLSGWEEMRIQTSRHPDIQTSRRD